MHVNLPVNNRIVDELSMYKQLRQGLLPSDLLARATRQAVTSGLFY